MRKRIINQGSHAVTPTDQDWLDLKRIAQVEIASEVSAYPVESALTTGTGWKAAKPGEQTIRILFDNPLKLKRIYLQFDEDRQERTHEFLLRWSADSGQSYQEIFRQQYTFSPPGTTREVEDYVVNLDGVTVLELRIVPDISGGDVHASLTKLRVS